MAVLSFAVGIGLIVKKQINEVELRHYQVLDDHDNVDEQALQSTAAEQIERSNDLKNSEIDKAAVLEEDVNATSYDDDLVEHDDEDQSEATELSPEAEGAIADLLAVADQAIRIKDQFSHTVIQGEKLEDILELSGLEPRVASQLIKQFPELAKLKTGQQFYWILDKFNELEYMNWLVSEKEEQVFERNNDKQFVRQILEKKSRWQQDVLKGEFKNSFSSSLKNLGLSQRQINQLNSGLQWQISTNKLKKGDKFAILVKREYIDDKVTELGNVEAIHIRSNNKSYYAIQAANGRYYSRHGETLGKGFARYPLQRPARVSSPFNPRRFHPVTHRIAPHRGTDFSVPIGTPVIAPADGQVVHVAYQAGGAGRYIKISHGREYETVYMHLSKPLVKPGQMIKKGQRIALSGNTGRSTGAHLHYEFHINGRPVNPMTVKLPGIGATMSEKDRKLFLNKAKLVEAKLKL